MASRWWREGSTAEWRRKARCAFPARFFETARSQRQVLDGGDGGRAHGAMGTEQWVMEEEDGEVTRGALFIAACGNCTH